MIDTLLHGIEKISGFLFNWAWKLRRKGTPPAEWIREYRRWKYSAKKDYKKILNHQKLYRRLVADGVINPKIQMKEVKKLLDEI